jgi:predicted ATPase
LVAHPGLAMLTTSREPLGVVDESVVEIPPLSTTDGAELFMRRAQASVSSFMLDPEQEADVARIVELVDGLPLALELASPLLRVLSPREIAEELTRGRALAPTVRSREVRHSSMDNAVAWSYDLLDPPARALFERFAVFEGGTDLSGVIEVCGDDGDGRLPAGQVREALQALVTRSLLAVDRTSSGSRYRMLVPVHAFAKRMLERSGEESLLRRRHVRHVIDWLTDNAHVIESDDPRPGFESFERAAANIRAAHDWCHATGDEAAAAEVLAAISTLAFREVTAFPELTAWVNAALNVDDLPAATRLRVLLVAALCLDQPQAEALEVSREALQLAQQVGDRPSSVLATVAMAHAVAESGGSEAIAMVAEVLTPSFAPQSEISSVVEGMALTYLCNYLARAGRHSDLAQLLSERLAFGTRRFGLYEAEVLYQSGRLARQLGDLVSAERAFRAAGEAARRTGALGGQSFALFGLATLAFDHDDLERSLQLFQETLELDQLVEPREVWAERLYIGIIACRLGQADLAAAQLAALVSDGRPIVTHARNLVAGCVAGLNHAWEVADRRFATAAQLAASMGSSVHLAAVYVEWARYTRDPAIADSLRMLSTEVRSGSLAAVDAEAARTAKVRSASR